MPSYTVIYETKEQEAAYRRLFKKYNLTATKKLIESINEPLKCLTTTNNIDSNTLELLLNDAVKLRSTSKLFQWIPK